MVEQHLHNIDVCNWFMGVHPVEVTASGGAAWRPREEEYGNIYDHLHADFVYANGVHMSSHCRQYATPAAQNVSERIVEIPEDVERRVQAGQLEDVEHVGVGADDGHPRAGVKTPVHANEDAERGGVDEPHCGKVHDQSVGAAAERVGERPLQVRR